MAGERICLISFSNNCDHQDVIYSMFRMLYEKREVYTIGIQDPKSKEAMFTERNHYYQCPQRPGLCKGTFRFRELWKMARMIRQENIHFLYFESQHLWNLFLMLLCPRNQKFVVVHDVVPHDNNKAMLIANYITCKLADHIVLRNHREKMKLAQMYHIKPEQITSLSLWRDFPAEKEPSYSKTFLYFGRIRKYKGLDLLNEIIERTPEINYRIIGEAGEAEKEIIEALSRHANVQLNCKEVSFQEMEDAFLEAEWIVLPYRSATQSGVICDAYRFSRPVIAFDVGAISEQVENEKTGILVPQGDIDKFCSAIRRASEMPVEEVKKYSSAAYRFGYEHYSAEKAVEQFEDMFKNYSA